MSKRKILRAADGMMLTDGDIYGKVIYLAVGADESRFYEVGEEEYEKMTLDASLGGKDAGP